MGTVIEIENLSKIYKKNLKKIHALKSVSFRVKKNQILGIMGPNGAGKTTLLKIITGIISPEKNSNKLELFETKDIKSVKHRIGFLPEAPEFFKNISAYELLKFCMKISDTPFQKEYLHRVLKAVNLYDERNEKIDKFSKGMRQRIGIAQAIIHSPDLLILDEPMSGLDPPGRSMVIDIIKSYHQEGKTILFSTHNLEDIETLCTDVIVLKNGGIRLERSIEQLREKSTYKIETIENHGKNTYKAENLPALWKKLEEFKNSGIRIVKVQSGIAEQLEIFYNEETTDETF